MGLSVGLVAAVAFAGPAPVRKWKPYQSAAFGFSVKVPEYWLVKEGDHLIAFRDVMGGKAAFGVLRNTESTLTADQAADEQMSQTKGAKPVRSVAILSERRAVKMVGSAPNDPSIRIVQYYISADSGYYLIQCIAPLADWPAYSAIFSTMLKTFAFLF